MTAKEIVSELRNALAEIGGGLGRFGIVLSPELETELIRSEKDRTLLSGYWDNVYMFARLKGREFAVVPTNRLEAFFAT